jgi:hypothetical protein
LALIAGLIICFNWIKDELAYREKAERLKNDGVEVPGLLKYAIHTGPGADGLCGVLWITADGRKMEQQMRFDGAFLIPRFNQFLITNPHVTVRYVPDDPTIAAVPAGEAARPKAAMISGIVIGSIGLAGVIWHLWKRKVRRRISGSRFH